MFHYIPAGYSFEMHAVRRIALGDLMPACMRETFPRYRTMAGHDASTGTIGFVDYVAGDLSLWTPTGLMFGAGLKVLVVGVEPQYQGAGHATRLLLEAERLARQDAAFIVMDQCNEASQALARKLEYWEVPGSRRQYRNIERAYCVADMAKDF